MAHHDIPATPEMMAWGTLDAARPPVVSVESGDTVTLRSFPAGGRASLPADASLVPADYRAALDGLVKGDGAHFVTGPVFVRGARPGDTLQVDILEAAPTMDWGFVSILPLLGTLPERFTEYETIHPAIDRARNVCLLPWGTEVPLDPFFGIMPVAPPREWGPATPTFRAPLAATWTTRN
ncbi:MAG TPA: acetamidase/formamidase family protein [Acetobacteraceae bacterium]